MKKIILFVTMLATIYADPVEDLKNDVVNTISTLHGWCTPEKALKFVDLVLKIEPDVCVEIGVFGGRSLYPVAATLKHLKKGVIVAIDAWDENECIRYFEPIKDSHHIDWWTKININEIYKSYLNLISSRELENQIITIRNSSERAANILGEIDLLHLDGNHGEIPSGKDVALYLPKVRSGGYIWINDSLSYNIQPSIDVLLEACELIDTVDEGNCILFRKK